MRATSVAPTVGGAPRLTFDECYVAHCQDVFRLCRRYGGGRRSFAEDATQDVFLQLFRRLDGLDHEQPIAAWLYTVATRVCVSRLRRESSVFRWLSFATQSPAPVSPAVDVLFERHEAAHAVMSALARLPARAQAVVTMKVLDGKTQKEIAAVLSLSEGTVSKILTRAYATLDVAGWESADAEI